MLFLIPPAATLIEVLAGPRSNKQRALGLSNDVRPHELLHRLVPDMNYSSTMTEIANATFNYGTLNEIMPMIYKRFTEKSAEEWRQIYKALQLLEFLIKNGSERVIDDARSHLSLLKMLRQFHFIDQNGKDQGINVRNRAKELADLLSDVDRIRTERKKARQTRGKYGGVEGGGGIGGSGSSRYGGFEGGSGGNPSFGGYSGGVYGDGGGFGGQQSSDYDDGTQSRRERFEEYDEHDEGTGAAPSRRKAESSTTASKPPKVQTPKPKEPEVDLFEFSADDPVPVAPMSNGKAPASTNAADDFGGFALAAGGDDDFDDFQSATQPTTGTASVIQPPASTSTTTSSTHYAQPKPQGGQSQNFDNFFSSTISPPPSSTSTPAAANYSAFKAPSLAGPQKPMQASTASFQQAKPTPTNYQATQPNYFGSISVSSSALTDNQSGGSSSPSISKPTASSKASSGGDPFANLGIGLAKKNNAGSAKGQSLADMAKQKTSASVWGAPAESTQQRSQQSNSGSGDDLLGL